MSNSPLVSYTALSPNHSGKRTRKIDTITPHCIVGKLSLQTLGRVFSNPRRQASSNYGIDDNGNVGMYVEEQNRSWCTSSNANDQRAVTIEVACDIHSPHRMSEAAISGLIKLCVDICKRNGIEEMKWSADPSRIGNVKEQNVTVHRWFSRTACPGDYLMGHLDHVSKEVNVLLRGDKKQTEPTPTFEPYTVRVNTNILRIRKGPGVNHPVVGTVRRNEVFTMVEESFGLGASKWGRLKSGAGWISLDYCAR